MKKERPSFRDWEDGRFVVGSKLFFFKNSAADLVHEEGEDQDQQGRENENCDKRLLRQMDTEVFRCLQGQDQQH